LSHVVLTGDDHLNPYEFDHDLDDNDEWCDAILIYLFKG
jgi:hypothetical protein